MTVAAGAGLFTWASGPATAASRTASVVAATSVTSAKAPAVTAEQRLVAKVNAAREANGRRPYRTVRGLDEIAEAQARRMATGQRLYHNPRLTTDVRVWSVIGENVAYASDVSAAHRALMGSPPHRANILSSTFTQMGVGVVRDAHGRVWVCEVFRKT